MLRWPLSKGTSLFCCGAAGDAFSGEVHIERVRVQSVTLNSGMCAAQRHLMTACAECTDSTYFQCVFHISVHEVCSLSPIQRTQSVVQPDCEP